MALTQQDTAFEPFVPEDLLFLDVETNGTLAHEHVLLQVGGFLTDHRRRRKSERSFEYVIRFSPEEVRAAYDQADPFVRKMHANSGLWDRVLDGTPVDEVDKAIHEFIVCEGITSKVRLAGNSAKLDFDFTQRYLPRTFSLLTYRILDMSAVAFWLASSGFTPGYFPKQKRHTSLADCEETLAEDQWMVEQVQRAIQGE